MGFPSEQLVVVARGNWQRQNTLADILEVNLHLRNLFGFLVFLVRGCLLAAMVGLLHSGFAARFALAFRFAFIRVREGLCGGFVGCDFFFVALRRQRRLSILLQDHHVRAARDRNLVCTHAAGDCRSVVGAGKEVEILPVPVEGAGSSVAQAVRNLMRGLIFPAVDKHGTQRAIELTRVGDPAAVRRPHWIEPRPGPLIVGIGVDMDRFAGLDVQIPEIQPLVAVHNHLAVGRPGRRVVKRRRIAELDFLHLTKAILLAHVQCVFPGLIGEIGNPFSIGGPRGIALGCPHCVGQVADVAMLHRHGQNLSMRFKHGPRACRGNVRVRDLVPDLHVVRPHCRKIATDLDANRVLFARCRIEQMNRAELFVDNGVRPRRSRLDVHSVTR